MDLADIGRVLLYKLGQDIIVFLAGHKTATHFIAAILVGLPFVIVQLLLQDDPLLLLFQFAVRVVINNANGSRSDPWIEARSFGGRLTLLISLIVK